MQSALQLARYAIEHARAAFGIMKADPQMENARFLRDSLYRMSRDRKTYAIGRRDAWQTTKRRLETAAAFDQVCGILENHGYIRMVNEQSRSARGVTMILLNPKWTGRYGPNQTKVVTVERPSAYKPTAYGAAPRAAYPTRLDTPQREAAREGRPID